jgi:hypothetical protein
MREFICEECKRIIFVLVEPEEDDPRDLCFHCLFQSVMAAEPDAPVLLVPLNTMPRCIERIWAWLSVDAAGNEGVLAGPSPFGGLMPLIAADEARLESLRPMARAIAAGAKMRIVLARFETRADLELIDGR